MSRPSLLHSPHTESPDFTGVSGRTIRSRKPVWAFGPSGVRIPPSPFSTFVSARRAITLVCTTETHVEQTLRDAA